MVNVDLCLVSSPLRATSQIVPQAFLWLAGRAEKGGYSSEIIDIKQSPIKEYTKDKYKRIFEETIERVSSLNPKIVGFSPFTSEFSATMSMAKAIRKICDAKIVIGGVHANIKPEDFYEDEDSPVDAVVIGEGEEILEKMLNAGTAGNSSWEDISSLVLKRDGEIFRTPSVVFREKNEDMPIPPYHKLDMEYYIQPQLGVLRYILCSGVHIFTSQGCPYTCTFCANRMRRVKYRNIETVIEEIRYLKETYDIDGFYIQDDTFTIKQKRVIEFCERLKAENLGMVWGMEGRVNQMPDNVFEALVDSGCIQMDFGVESGSQVVLDRMKKGIKVEDAERIFKLCRSRRVRTLANFLVNTPGETEEDVEKTVSLSKRLKANVIGHAVVVPYIGTAIYDEYVKPPLTIKEYDIFASSDEKSRLIDPRFRIASHRLNLDKLALKLNLQFTLLQRLAFISFHPAYLSMLFRSSRKITYLTRLIQYFIMRNMIYYARTLFKRIKEIMMRRK